MLLPTSGVLAYEEDRATLDGELTAPQKIIWIIWSSRKKHRFKPECPFPSPPQQSLKLLRAKWGR